MSDPDLVGSPAAFISTFALSSTHLDLIRGQPESVDAISLKADLMGALRNELRNEKTPQSLVAVVHLLLTELPTSDKDTLVVHARGLRKMVEARGGLHALTKDGNIASVLTM
ncbi:hypothetical protein M501DRAFT_998567 [Patellaria atrata CBS 101060]|uniref:Uncharacterized protein n=1 Tax=Patellaria atrata CBS 101060 TaxID=1346257 RepID=A0A9P4VSQ9_9PEZI|nr:hypothetical protein M501DRAFT_998567 [Patellaria atrata CBS 101060]